MSKIKMTKLDHALEAARRGFSVFPLVPNTKRPAIENWQNLATTDETIIRGWWQQWPEANPAIPAAGHIILDIDPRNGGDESFTQLLQLQDMAGQMPPTTLTSKTQSGGYHVIFRHNGARVRNGANVLGRGIDVKSDGGYIVAPGASIDGRPYRWANDAKIADAPAWLVDRCRAKKLKTASAGKRVVGEDDVGIELAQRWIDDHAPDAGPGQTDNTAALVARTVFDYGVTRETARELLIHWAATKCHRDLDEDDLARIVGSAERNRQNAIGSRHPEAPGFEPVSITERPQPQQLVTVSTERPGILSATPVQPLDPKTLPLRPWVVPGFACRARVTLLAGPGGVAKSTWVLILAVAIVTGRSDICGFPITRRERVWIWNQEDDREEMDRRLAAIMAAFNVSFADLTDVDGQPMLYIDSGVDAPLMLAKRTLEQSIVGTKQVSQVVDEVRRRKIGLLALDPLVEFHEASENDNVQMRAVIGQVRRIAVEGNCATLIPAHTRKPPIASSDGFAGEMDAARGASSQLGVVRVGATIFSMSPKMAKEWKIDGSHTDFVRIDIAKNNLAPPRPDPLWFKRDSVSTGGESVGVLRPIKLDRRVVKSDVDRPSALAKAINDHLDLGVFHQVATVVEFIPNATEIFGARKNWSRTVRAAFNENDEILTDSGKLFIMNRRENGALIKLEEVAEDENEK
jgi:hypothetical protein